MDRIFIHNIEVKTKIGVWEWERKIKQTVLIDLEIGTDIHHASKTDDIEDTLNYKTVVKHIEKFVAGSSFQLVETMAEKISEIILIEYKVPWVEVKVNKPGAISIAQDVGVIIRRDRK
jgi:dihydroneopterin aldolase